MVKQLKDAQARYEEMKVAEDKVKETEKEKEVGCEMNSDRSRFRKT
jgi:hypothetical protein